MTRKKVTDAEVAWAAGLFEGEGCTSLTRRVYGEGNSHVTLSLVTTDEDVLRRFHSIVGIGFVSGPIQRRTGDYKPFWAWRVTAQVDVLAGIRLFWPWLGRRRRWQAHSTVRQASWLRVERLGEHQRRGEPHRMRCGTFKTKSSITQRPVEAL